MRLEMGVSRPRFDLNPMDRLHDLYVAFTDRGWPAAILASLVLAGFILWRRTPWIIVICIAVTAALALPGWMLLDFALYPQSHNLFPLEVIFKLLILAPIALAIAARLRIDGRRSAKPGVRA